MSCTYADGLSSYDNKGVLGLPERFDDDEIVDKKCTEVVDWLLSAKHVVVHTGAGISTSAGIPDFRGPTGVWTLEKQGLKPQFSISFNDATPTTTHMALRALVEQGYVHYIISQNIDGLHMKSGLKRQYIAELHGNMFVEQCSKCRRQFIRSSAAETVGQRPCGSGTCKGDGGRGRACRGGILLDNILDWEDGLPERDLDMAIMHSTLADVNITLGTTLQITPSGNLPLKNKKHGGKLIICNLQPTKHDKKANLIISSYVDDILIKVCKRLGVEIPSYDSTHDPTKSLLSPTDEKLALEWTLSTKIVRIVEKEYDKKMKLLAQQKKVEKRQAPASSSPPFNIKKREKAKNP